MTRTSTILLESLKDPSAGPAWREFDGRCRPVLLGVGRRLGLNAADAEDAAQETLAAFVVQYRRGDYHRESGRLRDWLGGIMLHKVRDLQRRQRRGRVAGHGGLETSLMEQIPDQSVKAAMDEECASASVRECLDIVRHEVTAQTFESFELFALQQWPACQVAAKLGVSVDVVYQNKRRVLQRIRQLLPTAEDAW